MEHESSNWNLKETTYHSNYWRLLHPRKQKLVKRKMRTISICIIFCKVGVSLQTFFPSFLFIFRLQETCLPQLSKYWFMLFLGKSTHLIRANNLHYLTFSLSIISAKVTVAKLTQTRYHTEFFIQSNINLWSDNFQWWKTFANAMDSLWSLKLNHKISTLHEGCIITSNKNHLQRWDSRI